MAAVDIAATMMRMREDIPEELRVAGTMRGLAAATENYAFDAMARIMKGAGVTIITQSIVGPPLLAAIANAVIFAPQYKALLDDLREIRERIANVYLPALEGLPDDAPIPDAVRPLFFNIAGMGFFTPDALGPATLLNQFEELNHQNRQMARTWREDLLASTAEVAKAIAQKGGEVIQEIAPNLIPAVLGIAALGVVVFAYAKGSK